MGGIHNFITEDLRTGGGMGGQNFVTEGVRILDPSQFLWSVVANLCKSVLTPLIEMTV